MHRAIPQTRFCLVAGLHAQLAPADTSTWRFAALQWMRAPINQQTTPVWQRWDQPQRGRRSALLSKAAHLPATDPSEVAAVCCSPVVWCSLLPPLVLLSLRVQSNRPQTEPVRAAAAHIMHEGFRSRLQSVPRCAFRVATPQPQPKVIQRRKGKAAAHWPRSCLQSQQARSSSAVFSWRETGPRCCSTSEPPPRASPVRRQRAVSGWSPTRTPHTQRTGNTTGGGAN